jgi:hypothetical protein
MRAMTKEHILREIRRTADANGGVPLGRSSFFKETGIKVSDWQGKFWARWNDAVREAGVEPNQLQGAFGEASLIEKFIPMLREYGRFPVVAEMRLKKRSDASFPNEKTLKDRFGNRQQFASRILTFCRGRGGYEDIATICATALTVRDAESEDDGMPEEDSGFVYLIKSGRFYKIGRSNSVGRREYELAIQLPEKAATVHTIRTDDSVGIEEYWHKRFNRKRKNGEWFALESSDVAAFRRRKFM